MALERNQLEFQEKIQAEMEKEGLDALLLTRAESIFYATGYASRNAYEGSIGNTIAVVPPHGKAAVICSQFEANAAQECPDIDILSYPIWLYIADFPDEGPKPTQPDLDRTFRMAVEMLTSKAPGAKKIGVDSGFLPYERMDYLSQVYGRENIRDCSKVLVQARAIKTDWEISVLRDNAQMAERQFLATAKEIWVGSTEEDIMRSFAKNGLLQSPDVYGSRQAHTYAGHFSPTFIPRKHPLQDGDIVRLDGGIMRLGYTSDLARTFVVGKELKPEREKLYELLLGAHDIAMDMIGPGVKPGDVFHAMLKHIQKEIPGFKRGHFGHSTGCVRGEEAPFISDTNPRPFEPGMVFCVETPYYSSFNHTYNVEDTILITENGYERFTHANRTLRWPER